MYVCKTKSISVFCFLKGLKCNLLQKCENQKSMHLETAHVTVYSGPL